MMVKLFGISFAAILQYWIMIRNGNKTDIMMLRFFPSQIKIISDLHGLDLETAKFEVGNTNTI